MSKEKQEKSNDAKAKLDKPTMLGKVKQVIGAVVDVYFEGELPAIYTALEVKNGKEIRIVSAAW